MPLLRAKVQAGNRAQTCARPSTNRCRKTGGDAAWQAAPLYVVDIGEVDGALCVMELNPFSGADLYYCDAPRVVDIAARIAQRLFGRGNV